MTAGKDDPRYGNLDFNPISRRIAGTPYCLWSLRLTSPDTHPPIRRAPMAAWATRLLLFGALWFVLAGTDPVSWIIGVPSVVLASFAAERLANLVGADPKLSGMVRFVPFFLWESMLGGLDVARRVFSPHLPIAPALLTYRPRLTDPAALVAFMDSISLLPGTLTADFRHGLLQVHALDGNMDLVDGLDRLERRIAVLFGQTITGATECRLHWCDPADPLRSVRELSERPSLSGSEGHA
jgi:multicomponent Na+:H+ antiporter subunit E